MNTTSQTKVNKSSTNWVNNLTFEKQLNLYEEIKEYFDYETLTLVEEKYNKPIALKYRNV